jgi:hypothetical protein
MPSILEKSSGEVVQPPCGASFSLRVYQENFQNEPFVNGMNVAWVEFGRDMGTGHPA